MARMSPSMAYFLRRKKTRPGGLLSTPVALAPDLTAPTLSSASGTQTGSTTATLSVSTNEAAGTLYAFVSTSATPPNAATLRAGAGAVYASSKTPAPGANTFSATGLTASTAYYAHFIQDDAAANASSIVSSASFTTAAAADVTALTLSSPTGTQTGQTTATIGVTTNEANGTLYSFVSTSATPPSATNLKAGTGAVFANSQTITTTGAKTASATGLTAATAYYAHWLHRDAAGNDSAIATSASFTTAAAATNLFGNPNSFEITGAGAWNRSSVNVVQNDDGVAERVYPQATGTFRGLNQSVTIVNGTTYEMSFEVKPAGSWRYLYLGGGSGLGFTDVWYDLQTLTTGTGTGVTPTITDLGDGYIRVKYRKTAASSTSSAMQIGLADAMGSYNATLTATNGLFIRNALMVAV